MYKDSDEVSCANAHSYEFQTPLFPLVGAEGFVGSLISLFGFVGSLISHFGFVGSLEICHHPSSTQVPLTESSEVKESGQRQAEKYIADLGLPWTSFR